MEYLVIDFIDGEFNSRRFSSNADCKAYIEQMLNDGDAEYLSQFTVLRGEKVETLTLTESKRIDVSVGGM